MTWSQASVGLLAQPPVEVGDAAEGGLLSVPWLVVVGVFVVIVLLALAVWAIVRWRRRRTAAGPVRRAGALADPRLGRLWRPFYRDLPSRARHFPTVVVVGEAGVGKSHAIASHVDWRGQSNEFVASADRSAAMQLYVGPDVIVHELSAPVLRDVGLRVRRSLGSLWRRSGPTVTFVLVVDARTLLSTPPEALREIAQLVRGKIALLPRRCRELLDVNLLLSHLDRLPGYEEFAATMGRDHQGFALDATAEPAAEAARLRGEIDGHLARALGMLRAEEFDRLVGFYGDLPRLVEGLAPLLDTLAGRDQPFAQSFPVRRLYLGSSVPQSMIGNPFAVDRSQIAASMRRQRRQGLAGSSALAACFSAAIVGLMVWHGQQIAAADQAIGDFADAQDHFPGVSVPETTAAKSATAAIKRVFHSEYLWLAFTFQPAKRRLDEDFEEVIRKFYLEPRLKSDDRVHLLYVTALIYASSRDELGQLILKNKDVWADALKLTDWVVEAYVKASRERYSREVVLPDKIEPTGSEWIEYLRVLETDLGDGELDVKEVEWLRKELPMLRGPREYGVLAEVRSKMLKDPVLQRRLAALLSTPLDVWDERMYVDLTSLWQTIDKLRVLPENVEGWGLNHLVAGLAEMGPTVPTGGYVVTIDGVSIDSRRLAEVILRSRRHALLTKVLEDLERRAPASGPAFFDADAKPADAGPLPGYGGGPARRIAGTYTRRAFEAQVAPVLRFADEQLRTRTGEAVEGVGAEDTVALPGSAAPGDAAAPPSGRLDLLEGDAVLLDGAIRAATEVYAGALRVALEEYWVSFKFEPGSVVALPHVIKPFAQPNSWFAEFLRAMADNAALRLPPEAADPAGYYAPLREALVEYGPLVALLAEDAGVIPGLEPYQGLIAGFQKEVEGAASVTGHAEAADLESRLSGLGALTLAILAGTEPDIAEQVTDWLVGSGIDPHWWGPFLAPIDAAVAFGEEQIAEEVALAWSQDVRRTLDPLLDKYPFAPRSSEDVDVDVLEAIVRRQGKLPGTFWDAFDRLIRPALEKDRLAMLGRVDEPRGMLATIPDVERMSRTLWDEAGKRVPLEVALRIEPLPKEPVDGRIASMASLAAGGSSVFAFNNRPEKQILSIEWWDQRSSTLSLTMSDPPVDSTAPPDEYRYRLSTSGAFSFYRLLDRARSPDLGKRSDSITAVGIARSSCGRGGSGLLGVTLDLGVAVGAEVRDVRLVLLSDPWAPFALRRCT